MGRGSGGRGVINPPGHTGGDVGLNVLGCRADISAQSHSGGL